MSRGHGSVQVEVLRRWAGQTVPVNQVLWGFVEKGDLEKKVEVSVRRALDSLEESDDISIEKRILASSDELVTHYPWRTSSAAVRDMRQRLLPHLATFKPDKTFTTADNEDFDLGGDVARRELAKKSWAGLEEALLHELETTSLPIRRDVVALLARGYDLFEANRGISSSRAFTALAGAMESRLSTVAAALLGQFVSDTFPPERANRLRLKSWIGARINMPQNGEVAITQDALAHLWEHEEQYIHDQHGGTWHGFKKFGIGTVNAPSLNKLLRRDALWPMSFVTVPAS